MKKRLFARVNSNLNELDQNLGKFCMVIPSITYFKQTEEELNPIPSLGKFSVPPGLDYLGIAPPSPPPIANKIGHMANQTPRS